MYEALTESDLVITKQKQYHGMLSNIPPDVAAGMVARGSNLLKEKPPVTNTGAEPENKLIEAEIDKKPTRKKLLPESITSS